jgi:hypothetical protein
MGLEEGMWSCWAFRGLRMNAKKKLDSFSGLEHRNNSKEKANGFSERRLFSGVG